MTARDTRPTEFAGVEALGYATRAEADAAADRWHAEQGCAVQVREADGIDQAYCDLGAEMKWVVELVHMEPEQGAS